MADTTCKQAAAKSLENPTVHQQRQKHIAEMDNEALFNFENPHASKYQRIDDDHEDIQVDEQHD